MNSLRKSALFFLAIFLFTASICAAEPDIPQRVYLEENPQPVQLADPADFPAVSVRYQPTRQEIDNPEAFRICVNRRANTVTIYRQGASGAYDDAVMAMLCSVGQATPRGTYKISAKYEWRPLFGSVYGQYSVRIVGNILFHSVPYEEESKDTLKYDEYNKLGTSASMGCVRLCCADAYWIYTNCAPGTVVEIYDDDDPGPLGKPELTPIDPASPNRDWDPTDPDEKNPWRESQLFTPQEAAQLPEILGIE